MIAVLTSVYILLVRTYVRMYVAPEMASSVKGIGRAEGATKTPTFPTPP